MHRSGLKRKPSASKKGAFYILILRDAPFTAIMLKFEPDSRVAPSSAELKPSTLVAEQSFGSLRYYF